MNSYRKIVLKVGLSVAALLALSACGGGGSASTDAPVQGVVSGVVTKGPMSNALVTAYGISAGQMGVQLGKANTDSNGNFTMSIGSYAGPVMLQVSGGSYIDEATGLPMAMAASDVMTAVMPMVKAGASSNGIQVTPLTAMAQSMAQHMNGGMTDANIAAANAAMGGYYAVSDILRIAPMNPLVAGSGTGASQDAQNYGMTLAAMSEYAKTMGMSSSSAIVTAMMNDASDGVLDGMAGAMPVQMGGLANSAPLPASAGTSGMATAMSDFMNSAQNKSGITTGSGTNIGMLMTKMSTSMGKM